MIQAIHKRIHVGKDAHQLCRPISVWFQNWNYQNENFKHWALNDSAYHWKLVTCTTCLELRKDQASMVLAVWDRKRRGKCGLTRN